MTTPRIKSLVESLLDEAQKAAIVGDFENSLALIEQATVLDPDCTETTALRTVVRSMRTAAEHADQALAVSKAPTPYRAARKPTSSPGTLGPSGFSPKSRYVAGLLGILFPGIGAHNFYLAKPRVALLQILVAILTLGIGSIWGFCEGILIVSGRNWQDGDGLWLKN